MAKTLAQFLTYVCYDFKRDDKNTEIIQAYNDTIRQISNLEALEAVKFQSWIPTVVGQEDYPLPSSKCHVIHPIRIIEGAAIDNGYPLEQISKQEYSRRYPNVNTSDTSILSKSMPVDYCIYSNSILLGPVPDKATYIIELDWAKLTTLQAADIDVQELGEDWEEVIKWGTLFRLYKALGLDDQAAAYMNLFQSEDLGYPALLRKEKNQTSVMGTVKFRDL
jgi:hypothetical protein